MTREEILKYIHDMDAELEAAETFGEFWRLQDWRTRRSIAAGEVCLSVESVAKAEDKARRHPRSIGARKARGKIKRIRKRIAALNKILSEKLKDYKPTKPQYITGDKQIIILERKKRNIYLMDNEPESFLVE